MTVESAQVYRGVLPATRAGQREPRQPGRDGSADRRIEPQRAPACLPGIPDGNDLLRFRNRLALGLGALGLGGTTCGGAFPFLCSAVRTHGREATGDGPGSASRETRLPTEAASSWVAREESAAFPRGA